MDDGTKKNRSSRRGDRRTVAAAIVVTATSLAGVVALKSSNRSSREETTVVAQESVTVEQADLSRPKSSTPTRRTLNAARMLDELTGNMDRVPHYTAPPRGSIVRREPFVGYVLAIAVTTLILGFVTACRFGFRPRPLVLAKHKLTLYLADKQWASELAGQRFSLNQWSRVSADDESPEEEDFLDDADEEEAESDGPEIADGATDTVNEEQPV